MEKREQTLYEKLHIDTLSGVMDVGTIIGFLLIDPVTFAPYIHVIIENRDNIAPHMKFGENVIFDQLLKLKK